MALKTKRPVVIGVGQTDYSRGSGRSEWTLAVQAVQAALDDAGIAPHDVDGLVAYTQDRVEVAHLARSFGFTLTYYGALPHGGVGAPATIGHAATAIAGGSCRVVVAYRSLNGYSETRYGRAERTLTNGEAVEADGLRVPSGAFAGPYGVLAPGQVMAMWATRYEHENGLSRDELEQALGTVAVTQRAYANTNPAAVMRDRPLTMADYLDSRLIADPLRVCDHALETDGAAAVVIASADVAYSARSAVPVRGWVQGHIPLGEPVSIYSELRNGPSYQAFGRELFQRAGISPADVSVAMLYDATSISVLLGLEQYGFAPPGGGWSYLLEEGCGPDSRLPVNTNGGHLSEAYVHGMNLVIEAVRQCRQESVNQVPGAEISICTSGPSAVVFGR